MSMREGADEAWSSKYHSVHKRCVCVCVCSAHNEQMHASYEGREHRYSQHLGMVKDWEMTQMT